MAITHFEITELPDSNLIESTIDGNPLQIDTLYPIAQENLLSFERNSLYENLIFIGLFKWRVYDEVNDAYSNIANGNLFWRNTDINIIPESANHIENIGNNDTLKLIDILPINSGTEFIRIKSLSGIQNLYFKGQRVYFDQVLKVIDLFYTEFIPNSSGGGDPYFRMTYTANDKDKESIEYFLEINIDSIAELTKEGNTSIQNYDDNFDVNGTTENYNVIEHRIECLISSGHANGIAEISIDISSPFLSLNDWNKIIISNGVDELEKFENESFNINVQLDTNGKGRFYITNYMVEDAVENETGEIDITLMNINGNAALVSPTINSIEEITNN